MPQHNDKEKKRVTIKIQIGVDDTGRLFIRGCRDKKQMMRLLLQAVEVVSMTEDVPRIDKNTVTPQSSIIQQLPVNKFFHKGN